MLGGFIWQGMIGWHKSIAIHKGYFVMTDERVGKISSSVVSYSRKEVEYPYRLKNTYSPRVFTIQSIFKLLDDSALIN